MLVCCIIMICLFVFFFFWIAFKNITFEQCLCNGEGLYEAVHNAQIVMPCVCTNVWRLMFVIPSEYLIHFALSAAYLCQACVARVFCILECLFFEITTLSLLVWCWYLANSVGYTTARYGIWYIALYFVTSSLSSFLPIGMRHQSGYGQATGLNLQSRSPRPSQFYCFTVGFLSMGSRPVSVSLSSYLPYPDALEYS